MRVRRLPLNYLKFRFIRLLIFYILLGFGSIQAQDLVVQDSEGNALEGVVVFSDDFNYSASTDSLGRVNLPNDIVYPLNFQYLGFKPLKLTRKQLTQSYYSVAMEVDKQIIEEIILIGRTDIAQKDLAYESISIPRAEILLSNAQTSADALSANSAVYVQKSQMGGGSPVIRGFEANKLLLVVDGVRMNNAIYRGGHLQNAITIDPAILENMEVIFGPGSLMYGSDALGGVVHFQSKELSLTPENRGKSEGSYYARYGSSNHEKSAHIDFSFFGKKWASLSSITYTDYQDLKIGANRGSKYEDGYGLRPQYVLHGSISQADTILNNPDPLRLLNTGYNQFDFLQKVVFRPSDSWSFEWNNQFSTSSNIPRYDALTETQAGSLRYSRWDYGPQNRFLSSIRLKYVPSIQKFYDKIQLITAYQKIQEIRLTSNYKSTLLREQNEQLDIFNLTFDISRSRGASNWYTGLDANINSLNSRAYESTYSNTEKQEVGLTRYPNGENQTVSTGAYLQYYYIPTGQSYKLNTGIRYDINYVYTQFEQDDVFDWPDYFYDGVTNLNQSFNWSAGLHYDFAFGFKMRALAGSSFRAPNIDDLAKIRLNNDEISIPNTELSPEKSVNGELSLIHQSKSNSISITGFYTYLTDAIVRTAFALPDGSTQYITDGDTFNIVANVNTENARIQGVSLSYSQKWTTKFTTEVSLSFTKGDVLENGEIADPLAHIPPTYGRFSATYKEAKWLLRTGVRYQATKPIERYGNSTDNPEFATPEGALSWYTWNMTSQYQLHKSFVIQLGIDNILDQFYVPFASGVPGAGRHVSLTLKGDF